MERSKNGLLEPALELALELVRALESPLHLRQTLRMGGFRWWNPCWDTR